uniref:Zinc finger RING-H2-type domain-containing protein n=1 Tax=Sus scrofa TaxID=9823 RepID=A0A8D1NBF1_PIG
MDLCIDCQANQGASAISEECSIALGVCSHYFHSRCSSQWLPTGQAVPAGPQRVGIPKI